MEDGGSDLDGHLSSAGIAVDFDLSWSTHVFIVLGVVVVAAVAVVIFVVESDKTGQGDIQGHMEDWVLVDPRR